MRDEKRGQKSGRPGKDGRKGNLKSGKPSSHKNPPRVPGSGIIEKVEKIVSGLCIEEGIELVYVEFISESHHYYLRVYIDKEGGVTMGDCTRISRQLADIMDVNQIIDIEYRLEVSSPGINSRWRIRQLDDSCSRKLFLFLLLQPKLIVII